MIFGYGLLAIIAILLEWDISQYAILGICLFLAAFSYLRKKAKAKKFPIDLLLCGIGAILLILLMMQGRLFGYASDTFSYLMDFTIIGKLDFGYGWLLLLLTFAGGIIGYHILIKKSIGRMLLILGMITTLIVGTISRVSWTLLPVLAWVYESLHLAFEEYLYRNPQTKEAPGKEKKLLVILTIFLVAIFPNPTKPISWDGFITAWNRTAATVNEVLSQVVYGEEESDFGIRSTGFSNQGNGFWGAIVHGEDRQMMYMQADRRVGAEETYFVGNILETYSDNTWDKVENTSQNEDVVDNYEPAYEFEMKERLYYLNQAAIPSNEDDFFCQTSQYTFEYKSLRSATIFLPRNCYDIELKDIRGDIEYNGANTYLNKKQKSHNTYLASGMTMNLKDEGLITYLRNPDAYISTINEDQTTLFEECVSDMKMDEKQIRDLTSTQMKRKIAAYEKQIYKQDLDLPDSVSDKIYDLAKKITRDCDNDYDRIQAIVQYLKKDGGYHYTLSPEEAPDGEEEVAYFLFEDKKGYCSHFASATAVLCRCLGIPSRIAEGAAIAYGGDTTGISIYGRDSHAWTQVYLKGFGWYDVDATPSYSIDVGSFEKNKIGEVTGTMPEVPNSEEEENSMAIGRLLKNEEITWNTIASYVGIVVAGAIGLLCIFFLIRMQVQRYRYRHATNRDKCEYLMRKVLIHRQNRDAGMQPGETLREYAKRLDEIDMVAFLHWYESVRYGDAIVSDEDILNLEALWKKEKKLRKKLPRIMIIKFFQRRI